ncbi:hypothetical protein EYZ11_003624 [Aspergillus tanneri]|uniref:Uncharacterized protein n=1 Tax=Aspergillus tanneri TaxID=1220188 RepID=A0A4S3JPY5_9EURO|nr:uncharacterized protein ATNIH1004_006537 [Aspergillus tanneri]KAA8647835.1 hypothetical protein ATNIH1004_006537 [Aspergillus tanneri]THC96907.1 hypothetical protein EYZ11_003624 [Aspergillus tanneri]
MCAAWSVLLASHGYATQLRMFAPRLVKPIGTLSISVDWSLYIGDLIGQIQAKLADSLLNAAETAQPDDRNKSGEEQEYELTFFIAVNREQPVPEQILFECQIQDGRICTRAVGHDS